LSGSKDTDMEASLFEHSSY